MRPEAIASRRMFIPHQPLPMSAVRYFFPSAAANGSAAIENETAEAEEIKERREVIKNESNQIKKRK
ncbi:hypothetical protein BGE01nite_14460 [Brevifollis gellanilyticus]|uniref:Uncharacterized protein n=1 Tax=Brevifollis gellanilyticus TaxID=748831 RepID=A0A512M5Z5_9BACT|nr:hypothetical protein BGE01nite_14460 [Brevifollis gellanilyticus]